MNESMFLEGENIYLNPIKSDDVQSVMKFMNNENIRILARSRRNVMNESNTKTMIENMQKNEEAFIIYKKINDEKIGYALIMDRDEYNREAMIGLSIEDKQNRGKGFGGNAIKLLLKHGFINLNLESVYLGVYEYNVSAIKIYEKIGFKHVGNRRNAKIIGNKKYNEIIMDMVSDEYFELYGNTEMKKLGI
jgi:RimJ/RimL family protein N-acetyltransferase